MERPSPLKSNNKKRNGSPDLISQLPDGILGHILSLLSVKEAGRTSVLSSRWTNLWKFIQRLNFDVVQIWPLVFRPPVEAASRRKHQMSTFVSGVNTVLRLHELPYLDSFVVDCDLDETNSSHIDEWMKLIILKRVKVLDMDFRLLVDYPIFPIESKQYTLSQEFKSRSNLVYIKSLNSLSLQNININGEYIEHFLCNCPLLERLCVVKSKDLVSLKVIGSSLKYLYIGRCLSLDIVELCAPKLGTFIFRGEGTRLVIGKNPLLTVLTIGGHYSDFVHCATLLPFASHFPQLEDLTLECCLLDIDKISQVSKFSNLKYLKICVDGGHDGSIVDLTNLVVVASSLHELCLKVNAVPPETRSSVLLPVLNPTHPHHRCLKKVEISGFVGCRVDTEIATYLAMHAINLENMTVVVSYESRFHHYTLLMEYYPQFRKILSRRCKLAIDLWKRDGWFS